MKESAPGSSDECHGDGSQPLRGLAVAGIISVAFWYGIYEVFFK